MVHLSFLSISTLKPSTFKSDKPKELLVQIENPSSLPRIEKIGKEKRLKEVISDFPRPELERQVEEVALEEVSLQPVKEKIEVLNPAMLCYQDMVKQRIEEVKKYPEWAKEQGIEGTVYLRFVILSDGHCPEIRLLCSSGRKILDEEAIATIKRASPFPPLPKEINNPFIQMEVSLVFTLK